MKLKDLDVCVGYMPEAEYIGVYRENYNVLFNVFMIIHDRENDNIFIDFAKPEFVLIGNDEFIPITMNIDSFQTVVPVKKLKLGESLENAYYEFRKKYEFDFDYVKYDPTLKNGELYIAYSPEGEYIGAFNKKKQVLEGLFGVVVDDNDVVKLVSPKELNLSVTTDDKIISFSYHVSKFQGFVNVNLLKWSKILRDMYLEVATGDKNFNKLEKHEVEDQNKNSELLIK